MKKLSVYAFGLALLGASTVPSNAALWDVTGVLSGAGVGGYGASWFHTATASNAMGGSNIGNIIGVAAGGFYNNVTGTLDVTLAVNNGSNQGNYRLTTGSSSFSFANSGGNLLTSTGTLDLTHVGGTLLPGINPTTLGFKSGSLGCCSSGTDGPNSFIETNPLTTAIMTLWGANGFFVDTNNPNGAYANASLGVDLRLAFDINDPNPGPDPSPVPIPAAFPLLAGALGLLGFSGWRRKRSA